MGCSDNGAAEYYSHQANKADKAMVLELQAKLNFVSSALCMTLTHLENLPHNPVVGPFNDLDFIAAGITEYQLLGWWTDHKEQDAIRLKTEADKKEAKRIEQEQKLALEQKKAAALSKLTFAEKILLGLDAE